MHDRFTFQYYVSDKQKFKFIVSGLYMESSVSIVDMQ